MDGTTAPRQVPKHHGLSAKTLRRLEHASGSLASASIAVMERRLPWFARLPADQRASVLLITQAGAAGFVDWLRDSKEALKLTTEAFRDAPAELSRWISLRQAVGMVRLAIEVFEEQLPDFAANEAERGRADRRNPALRPGNRLRGGEFLRGRGRSARCLGRAAGGAGRRRHRPRRRRGVGALAGHGARLGPVGGGDRPGRQPAVGGPADGGLRGPQPRGPRRASGAAVGAGFPAGGRGRRPDRRRGEGAGDPDPDVGGVRRGPGGRRPDGADAGGGPPQRDGGVVGAAGGGRLAGRAPPGALG